MPTISVQSDMQNLLADVDLEARAQSKAAVRALNTAIRGLRTDAGRELRKRYPKLKLKDINALITIVPASAQTMKAILVVRGRPLSLMRFFAGKVATQGKGGVWVDVKGVKKFIPHAWVATMQNKAGDDYQVIFIREGKGRFPVKVLKTIDIPNALNIKEIRDLLDDLTVGRFTDEFARQIQLYQKL